MTKKLSVEISDELYLRFTQAVSEKGGLWRGKREKPAKTVDSAVEVALSRFLDWLEKGAKEGEQE